MRKERKTETVYNLGEDVTLDDADINGDFDWSLNKESLTADYASGATVTGGLGKTHGEVITIYAVEKNYTASDIVLRVTDTYIQWKYSAEDDSAWRNLVALSDITGAQGPTGADGQDGQDGQDGITPELRINSETNMWEVSYDDGASWISLGVKATGADGQDGQDGADGQDGQDGINGTNGTDGTDGQDGKDGVDGQSGGTVALYVLTSISLAGLIAMAVILIIKRKTLFGK